MRGVCEWLDACEQPAEGHAAHAVHGVIKICGQCAAVLGVPMIRPSKEVTA